MINIKHVKRYCKDYNLIENYQKAIEDPDTTWECHHKLEIGSDYRNTIDDLIMMNLYYDRPPEELIFLKRSEHMSLHFKGIPKSKEQRSKMSTSSMGKLKGRIPWNKGKAWSEEVKIKISNAKKKEVSNELT